MVTLADLLEAYWDCRRNKRTSKEELLYEMDYERRLIGLRDEVNAGTYRPSTSVCFVVTRPRRREVFASAFGDRVMHHWMALRLEPLLEAHFTDRSFNCRRGKGQLHGVETLRRDIYECSGGYTKDCWLMRLDIRGLFMSIDRRRLADLVERFIEEKYEGRDKDDLKRVARVVVEHAPENDCETRSDRRMWEGIPPHKSLFTNGEGMGMPIGNLPSQHLANLLLDALDKFVIGTLGFAHYGRYVDDFYVVHGNKAEMLNAVPGIREFLADMGLTLHPRKFYLQHHSKGMTFVGCAVKLGRAYPMRRTVYGFKRAADALNAARGVGGTEEAVSRVNSYLGLLRHQNSYAIRRDVLEGLRPELFKRIYIRGHHEAVVLKMAFRRRAETKRMMRNGEWEQGRVSRDAGAGHGSRRGPRPPLAGDGGGGRGREDTD